MCDVLVRSGKSFENKKDKKKFQEKRRIEIKKTHPNAVIIFIFADDKNANKTAKRYLENHPRAIQWEVTEAELA